MKKVFAVCAIGLMAVGFTSCKKDYTCNCEGTGTQDFTYEGVSKDDAEESCDNQQTVYQVVDPQATCGLD